VPQPEEVQLQVKVAVAGMNPFDWKVADGAMEGVMPHVFPLILGGDAAGKVTAVGSKVSRFRQDDRVFGQFVHAPIGQGTYAEFTVVPESGAVTKIPAGVSDEIAAALPTAGMTALSMTDTLQIARGSKVLIVGATGGVGLFATQLAAAKGLTVLGTAGPNDRERLISLGAAETFEQRGEALATQVSRAHPEGIQALIDLVSEPATFASLTRLVTKGGYALTTIGSANTAELEKRGLRGGNFYLKAKADLLDRLLALVERKQLVVAIEAAIALEAVPAAVAASKRGGARGKTLIRIG
jgi:NADPH:quinone reductase-like Zn-dependent oxidoreductase